MLSFPHWLGFWLRAARFEFFTGSLAPVLVGSAAAWWQTGRLSWPLALATLVALVLLHASANLANDYWDHLSGNDALNRSFVRPFTGGSRFIQRGEVRPRAVLAASLLCLAGGAALGFVLVWLRGWPILALGVVGGLSGLFYTARPVALGYRGLGELFIALDFGVLPVLGAYYVQAQAFSWPALAASLPVALLISAILWINQFPDYAADLAVGKRHWVVRLGRRRAAVVYAGMMTLTYVLLLASVAVGLLPPLVLLAALALPLLARGIDVALREYDHPRRLAPANAATIALHLACSVLVALGLVLDRLL